MNPNDPSRLPDTEPQISVNKTDGAVAIDEGGRTVFLTPEETIVVEKPVELDIAPANRPRKVYGGMWGPYELAAVAVGLIGLLAALAIFLLWTIPAKQELARNKATRDKLEADLASARAKYGNITDTETAVAKLVSSVDTFEANYLPVASNGRTALYQRINGLIAAYGLLNTSGPEYAPLDISAPTESATSEERGRARFQSLFPGAYVTVTLEGSYQNLRRFIRDIETGQDFVVISSIELEPSESQNTNKEVPTDPASAGNATVTPNRQPVGNIPNGGAAPFPNQRQPSIRQMQMQMQPQPQTSQPTRSKGRTVGEVVSLRLEMAAYFRRPAPAETQTTEAGQ